MKNIYAILLSIFFVSGAYAQSGVAVSTSKPLFKPLSVPQKPVNSTRALYQFVTDYDYSDSISEVTIAGNLYDVRYAWDINMNYLNTDSSYRYCIVVFDSIIDSYNQISYDRSALSSVTLDSLHILLGQENNSGLDDTLIVKVLNVQANRIPGTTVLWSDTIIFAAGAPLGTEWLQFNLLSIPVAYSYSNTTRIAVKLEYFGDKMDTAGFLSGFGYNGTCTSGLEIAYDTYMNPVPYNPNATAFPAGFNANSYVYYTAFSLQFPATNNYIYYPCDATPGYQPGSDAFNLWQNIGILGTFTVDDSIVGINDQTANGIKLFQNNPNPFSNETTIHYNLQKGSKVTIEVTDLTGRVVAIINEGYRNAGNFSTTFNAGNLSEGTYFYTLKTDNSSLTNRMVIKR